MRTHSITRRSCLAHAAAAVTATAASWPWGPHRRLSATTTGTRATTETLTVLLNEPIRGMDGKPSVVSPLLHGHFVEHLGGVVYDGIWVGESSTVPHVRGIRKAIIDSLRKIGPPVMRWPGGCFADAYHWRDGIGPREARPRRFGRWDEKTESNSFGTHEFMDFCRQVAAEPYFAANVGSGTAREFQEWVEYCNAPAGRTTLADERVANNDRDPFKIRFWGVGNENWGCGGTFTPEDYAAEYRKFTTWVPGYGVPLYLIACGPTGNTPSHTDWTRRFMKKWRDGATAPLQGLSAHYYCGTSGTAMKFTTDQWYDLLDAGNRMESFILESWAAMAETDPQHQVKLVLDEWGCWHPDESRAIREYSYSQPSTLRDALVAGLTLDTFHRHADKVSMGCVAQLVNCLQSLYLAVGDRFVETVNHHVFAMYRDHQGGTAVPIRTESEPIRFSLDGKPRSVFRVAGSASLRDRTLTLTLVHTHASEPRNIAVRLAGGARVREVAGTILTHKELNAADTFETPNEVIPREWKLAPPRPDGEWIVELPPAAVMRLRIGLA